MREITLCNERNNTVTRETTYTVVCQIEKTNTIIVEIFRIWINNRQLYRGYSLLTCFSNRHDLFDAPLSLNPLHSMRSQRAFRLLISRKSAAVNIFAKFPRSIWHSTIYRNQLR